MKRTKVLCKPIPPYQRTACFNCSRDSEASDGRTYCLTPILSLGRQQPSSRTWTSLLAPPRQWRPYREFTRKPQALAGATAQWQPPAWASNHGAADSQRQVRERLFPLQGLLSATPCSWHTEVCTWTAVCLEKLGPGHGRSSACTNRERDPARPALHGLPLQHPLVVSNSSCLRLPLGAGGWARPEGWAEREARLVAIPRSLGGGDGPDAASGE